MAIILPNQILSAQQMQPVLQRPNTTYLQFNTKNTSFLHMQQYLQHIGIRNNGFMLLLYDPDLANIDPRTPNLPIMWQQRILRECMLNYWYFIREIVRIPSEGGSALGVPYFLHRGNLAFNFLSLLNCNIFEVLPRQQYKTVSALIRYLYLFNFGTSYSKIGFLNKDSGQSMENLETFKKIRALLPSYLRFDQPMGVRGGLNKARDNVKTLDHVSNGNKILTFASAINRFKAANTLRGKTIPFIWFDEYAFIPFNKVIYLNGVPAYKTAAQNARNNGKAYGILITTTPGDLNTDEGVEAWELKEDSTRFSETFYDMTYQQIMNMLAANKKTNFVYLEYSYKQLGKGEDWLESICQDMRYQWDDIRREVLLEWSIVASNSPFDREDLEVLSRRTINPLKTILMLDKFPVDIYSYPEYLGNKPKYPPIIGVDVAPGYRKDSSAITIIDSYTTKVIATFKNNSIDFEDLALLIREIVVRYMPNAVINVERNGGYGASVLAKLMKLDHGRLKRNIYYEIKDRVIEETFHGVHPQRKKIRTKIYGTDSSHGVRENLIDILKNRVKNHKDKIIAREIYNELKGMEVKKNGKVEHSNQTHDDLVFSYLMALYVWYEGVNLTEWEIEKASLKTDDDIDEPVYDFDEPLFEIYEKIKTKDEEENKKADNAYKDLEEAQKKVGISFDQWNKKQQQEDDTTMEKLISTKLGRIAYATHYNMFYDNSEENIKKGIAGKPMLDMVPKPSREGVRSQFMNIIMTDTDDVFSTREEKEQKLYRKNFNLELIKGLDTR